MYDYQPHTFDTRAFRFGAAFLLIVATLCTAVRYGTVLASEKIQSASSTDVTAIAKKVANAKAEKEAASFQAQLRPRIVLASAPLPRVSAKSFIVGDLVSGDIYAQKDATTTRPIASITKLITTLAALDIYSASSTIDLTKEDRRSSDGTPGSIARDETFTFENILYPLLMESNNSVANALAREADFDAFITLMHDKARESGMQKASFEDASGISSNNRATAYDIFQLTYVIQHKYPELWDLTRTQSTTVQAESGRAYPLRNFNHYASNESFRGGKTGYTDAALETMTAVFTVPVNGLEVPIAIVVLGSKDRVKDIDALRTWFSKNARLESPIQPSR